MSSEYIISYKGLTAKLRKLLQDYTILPEDHNTRVEAFKIIRSILDDKIPSYQYIYNHLIDLGIISPPEQVTTKNTIIESLRVNSGDIVSSNNNNKLNELIYLVYTILLKLPTIRLGVDQARGLESPMKTEAINYLQYLVFENLTHPNKYSFDNYDFVVLEFRGFNRVRCWLEDLPKSAWGGKEPDYDDYYVELYLSLIHI